MPTSVSSFFEWQGENLQIPVQFYWTDDGNIRCQSCPESPTWCMHIEMLTTENGDAEPIWLGEEELNFDLQIPLFPTSGLWVKARLVYVGKLNAYKVGIDTEESTENLRMGYLHQGEGRGVIRNMILDWFDGVFGDNTNLKCMSASHKPLQEMAWVEAMRDKNKRIKNLWSVWDTHSCIACTVSPDSFSDLVPDASSTRRSVF